MMRNVISPLLVVAMLVLSANCVSAQKPAKMYPDEIGVLYLGSGQTLAAIKPRLLTKNAHVTEFLCSPARARVAYISHTPSGDGFDDSLWITTAQSGDSTRYFTSHEPKNENPWAVTKNPEIHGTYGWSDDAAYFAFAANGRVDRDADP
ncbi:MAG TPA: hypothetical protein VFW40_01870, partial [Capsulimonadaceae bacterium]|nr:hypothetical protein [Capsulimonadaceae bacterium]